MGNVLKNSIFFFKFLDAIALQVKQIEKSFLEYEDACDRLDLERQKIELKVKLSELVETKQYVIIKLKI